MVLVTPFPHTFFMNPLQSPQQSHYHLMALNANNDVNKYGINFDWDLEEGERNEQVACFPFSFP